MRRFWLLKLGSERTPCIFWHHRCRRNFFLCDFPAEIAYYVICVWWILGCVALIEGHAPFLSNMLLAALHGPDVFRLSLPTYLLVWFYPCFRKNRLFRWGKDTRFNIMNPTLGKSYMRYLKNYMSSKNYMSTATSDIQVSQKRHLTVPQGCYLQCYFGKLHILGMYCNVHELGPHFHESQLLQCHRECDPPDVLLSLGMDPSQDWNIFNVENLWSHQWYLSYDLVYPDVEACSYLLCVPHTGPCIDADVLVVAGVRTSCAGGWEGWAANHHSALLLSHVGRHGGHHV